jgi:hypothetical protein
MRFFTEGYTADTHYRYNPATTFCHGRWMLIFGTPISVGVFMPPLLFHKETKITDDVVGGASGE